MRTIGDERVRMLVYPSVWLFDGNAKPLMQMPAGTGTFETGPSSSRSCACSRTAATEKSRGGGWGRGA
jgi:hypothetical protein